MCEHDEVTKGCPGCQMVRHDYLLLDAHFAKMASTVYREAVEEAGCTEAEILAVYLDCLPMTAEATSAGIFGA